MGQAIWLASSSSLFVKREGALGLRQTVPNAFSILYKNHSHQLTDEKSKQENL